MYELVSKSVNILSCRKPILRLYHYHTKNGLLDSFNYPGIGIVPFKGSRTWKMYLNFVKEKSDTSSTETAVSKNVQTQRIPVVEKTTSLNGKLATAKPINSQLNDTMASTSSPLIRAPTIMRSPSMFRSPTFARAFTFAQPSKVQVYTDLWYAYLKTQDDLKFGTTWKFIQQKHEQFYQQVGKCESYLNKPY